MENKNGEVRSSKVMKDMQKFNKEIYKKLENGFE